MADEQQASAQESFISHLVELRDRLVKAVAAIAVVAIILLFWPGAGAIYDFIAQPMINSLPEGSKMISTGISDPFLVPMKVTLLVAFVMSLPWVLYQVWAFVAPGLYTHEKRLIAPLVISSSLLFVAGVAFCYLFVFGRFFKFINDFAPKSITVSPDIGSYIDFVMTMCLAFGVTFEMPVVVVVLVRMGLVSVEKLKEIRGYVIVGIAIIAALVTPPDAVSMLSLMIPMALLYELGLLLAPLFVKATQRPEERA
ncbi:twin-arginine translocase subunit TatC [soil metagenome]